ncbi:MAG: hypothetical protein K8S23_01615 [Candidatus Cloacimonetes bacterium]|nr:hypothetical protein [Candidatus Cloacimonadota bacterium]
MKIFKLVLIGITLLITASCSKVKTKMFLKMKGGKGVLFEGIKKIDFEISGVHTMRAVASFDDIEIPIVIDTGGMTIIDKQTAKEVNLELIETPQEDVSLAKIKNTKLGNVSVTDLNAGVIDFVKMFKTKEEKCFGMIGSDFFRFYQTTFDYNKQQISFTMPKKLQEKSVNEHLLDMEIVFPYFPTVEIKINGNKIRGMIDTGLNYPFVLPIEMKQKLTNGNPEKVKKAKGFFCKWPFTDEPDNQLFLANEIEIGDIKIENQAVFFAQLPKMMGSNVALIGKCFLDQYIFTLDYQNKQVLLKESEKNNFSLNYTAGIKIVKRKNSFKVIGIFEDSPADKAGIVLETKINRINGKTPSEITNKELDDLLLV